MLLNITVIIPRTRDIIIDRLTNTNLPIVQMCKFFQQQRCRFGSNCRLSHGMSMLVSPFEGLNPLKCALLLSSCSFCFFHKAIISPCSGVGFIKLIDPLIDSYCILLSNLSVCTHLLLSFLNYVWSRYLYWLCSFR